MATITYEISFQEALLIAEDLFRDIDDAGLDALTDLFVEESCRRMEKRSREADALFFL